MRGHLQAVRSARGLRSHRWIQASQRRAAQVEGTTRPQGAGRFTPTGPPAHFMEERRVVSCYNRLRGGDCIAAARYGQEKRKQ